MNKEKNPLSIYEEKKLIYKKTRTMPSSDPILRCLMSENNEVIYRDYEKGNDIIFRDHSQPIYLLHINNRKKGHSQI